MAKQIVVKNSRPKAMMRVMTSNVKSHMKTMPHKMSKIKKV